MDHPLIIRYVNLLHKYGDPDSATVEEFRRQHATDEVFIRRAAVIDRVWRMKKYLRGPGEEDIS